jgi:hypothetical protein
VSVERDPFGVRRAPELVGPDREDVSTCTDRALILRCIDAVLHMQHDLGRHLAAITRIERRLLQVEATGPSMRDPDSSWHDYDADWERARLILRDKVKDPRDPMDSDRVRALAKDALLSVETGRELRTWRTVKNWPRWLAREGLKALVPLIVGGAAVYLWHLLSAR